MNMKNAENQTLKGLSSSEVNKRIEKYGPNEIPEKEETLIHRIFRRFWGPIPWMIEAAAILSAAVKKWEDFSIIMVMLLVNAILDFYQESKALNAINALKKSLASKALVLRDGKWQDVDAKEIVPDDIIKLKIGDIVPADAKLIDGDFILADQSALTGESLPVTKKVGDEVYGNAIVKKGEMIAKVSKTGLDTYFGKTVKLVSKAQKEQKSHFQAMVIKVGNFLILLTVLMIAIIIGFGLYRHENIFDLLEFSLVLTVAAIPVALPTVLTVTMAVGAINLARKKAIVSRLAAIEELAGMDILCSDKTGTLTKNEMTISEPYSVDGFKNEDVLFYGGLASKEENQDPIEKPIFQYLKEHKLYDKLTDYKLKKFTPFDPVNKKTVSEYDKLVVTKGAPQVIIAECKHDFDKKEAQNKVKEYASKGFRTLGVAFKNVGDERFRFVGLIPLYDPPRDDSKETIEDLKAHGVSTKMVTGDNIEVAKYIAGILAVGTNIKNIKNLKGQDNAEYKILAEVITESLVKRFEPKVSDPELKAFANDVAYKVQKALREMPLPKGHVRKHESEIIELIEQADGFAQVFPEDKYYIVDKLQKGKHIVGMTGDGVNDAPALKKADCGIAVSGATDAARAAGDIILMAPGLNVINSAIKMARITFERMKGYTIYRIAETVRVILFMTLAIVVFKFYPVTALMIILLALLNDIPILTIAYDNTKVRKFPVRWDMKEVLVLSGWLGTAGVISSFGLLFLAMDYWHLSTEMVQSLMFVKLIVAGHGTIYNTRIDEWFFKKPGPNIKLWTGTASLASAILGTLIGVYGILVTPIGWKWGAIVWGYAFFWFLFNDVVKMLVLRFYRKRGELDI
ncbi:MAG: plasma-membrane proton-efflux P-type ATPase [Chlorobi bacterium]|nr:plasma-membrane proton-efflux P-type ATPase [Chlorobiota bacterium]